MGFFSLKAKCEVCEKECGLNRFKIVHGWICPTCMKACGFNAMTPMNVINSYSLDQLKEMSGNSEQSKELQDLFFATQTVAGYFEVDEKNKLWAVNKFKKQIYKFEDIVEYEVIEDNASITKGGAGRAAVGGLLFGGVGAIVGGSTGKRTTKQIVNSLKIKVTLNGLSSMPVYIDIISTPTKNYQQYYAIAEQITSLLANIVRLNDKNQNQSSTNNSSNIDDLRKYKQLLDDGIITEEEFQAKKKQILGL